MRVNLFTAVALAVSLVSVPVLGQDAAAPTMDEIREMVLYANYRDALSALSDYLGQPGLTAEERNAGLELMATAQLATRDEEGARQTLALLYARDPEHRLTDPDASPVVQAAFARARGSNPQPMDVTVDHEPPGELSEREAPLVRYQLGEGGDAVSELRLSYRQGDGRWVRVVMDIDETGGAEARIPLLGGAEAYEVQYFAQALAPSGAVLASLGTRDEPMRLLVPERQEQVAILPDPTQRPVAEPEEGGIATKWWFWTIVGVAVAGGVTGAVVATSGDSGPPGGSLGNFRLETP